MKKLTKKEMVEEIKVAMKITDEKTLKTLMRKKHSDLYIEWFKCTADFDIDFEEVEPLTKIEDITKEAVEASQTQTLEGKKMKENFVIGAKDLVHGKLGKTTKLAEATPAVEAVKGIKAVAAVEANKEEKIQASAAVGAVKAVKAAPAKEATLETSEIYLKCVSQEVADEAMARIIDQGHEINGDEGSKTFEDDGMISFSFTTTAPEDAPPGTAMKMWRAVVNKCKAKDGYNAPGLAILKAEAKKTADAEKAEAKAKEPKGNVKSGKSEPEPEENKEGDDEWPS